MDRSKRTLKPPVKISILEKDESEVSHCWKTCQLFSYVLIIISGIGASMSMANILKMFSGDCILYSNLAVNAIANSSPIQIDVQSGYGVISKWGDVTTCDYCQFCPVASVIFSAVWGTLFIMCGHGGNTIRNLPQPWRIVPPAIIFNFIFLILSSVNAALTFGGFETFCSNIKSQINISSCEDLGEVTWKQYPQADHFYDDIVIAETGAAVGVVGWLLGFVVLLIRVFTHADFFVIKKVPTPHSASSPASHSTTSTSLTISTPSSSSESSSPQKLVSVTEPLIHQTPKTSKAQSNTT